jgi:hypothetical protein
VYDLPSNLARLQYERLLEFSQGETRIAHLRTYRCQPTLACRSVCRAISHWKGVGWGGTGTCACIAVFTTSTTRTLV